MAAAVAIAVACGGAGGWEEPPFPAGPTSLDATGGDGQVALSWTASPGATGYKLYRWTAAATAHVLVASPAGTSYTDTAVENGTTYYYVVLATNAAGEGPPSNEASATPTGPPPATQSASPDVLSESARAKVPSPLPRNTSTAPR
jgi:cellulose 1,4-beta-cellobiosidase